MLHLMLLLKVVKLLDVDNENRFLRREELSVMIKQERFFILIVKISLNFRKIGFSICWNRQTANSVFRGKPFPIELNFILFEACEWGPNEKKEA